MERKGHRGHNTYGRLMNYAGNSLLVLAKSYGPQAVLVEFVKPDMPEDSILEDRVAYQPIGGDEVHVVGSARRPDVTMPALVQAIYGKIFEREPVAVGREKVGVEEVNFVVDFFRDPSNNVLLSRYSSKGIGERLGYIEIVDLGGLPLLHLKAG